MIFLCFVETEASAVPHMEPILVDTLEEARVHARRMLEDHRSPVAAHIFLDEQQLDTLRPGRRHVLGQEPVRPTPSPTLTRTSRRGRPLFPNTEGR